MRIKAYTGYNYYRNIEYYEYFDVVNELPKIGNKPCSFDVWKIVDIKEIDVDYSKSYELRNYKFYRLMLQDENNPTELDECNIAIPIDNDDEE